MTLIAIIYLDGGPKSTRIAQIDFLNCYNFLMIKLINCLNGYKMYMMSAMHTIDYDIESLLWNKKTALFINVNQK